MKAGKSRSKDRKFRRTGRHTAPSQAQKVAQRAGKAAPAVAVVGALAAAPQTAFAATSPRAAAGHAAPATRAQHVTRAHLDAGPPARTPARPRHPGRQAARSYTVRTGDTLSGIAQRFYGHATDWEWLYHINRAKISDPNLIYTGQVFSAPADPPASVRNGTYQARHARSAVASSAVASGSSLAAPQPAARHGRGAAPRARVRRALVRRARVRRARAPRTPARRLVTACRAQGRRAGWCPANYAAIVSFLTAHGYTGNAAAGIAGNIWQESGGNPESVGDGGGGLIGWTPLPGGYVTGNYAADLQTQLTAVLAFNRIWSQYIPALNAASSPAAAAAIYVTDFERAGIPAVGNREAAAEAVAAACGI